MSDSTQRRGFEEHRRKITELYWDRRLQLPRVREIMKDEYGFDASPKMYKKYIKQWGLVKNCTTEESIAMVRIAERRRKTENKATVFMRLGMPCKPANLRRFVRRSGLASRASQDGDADEQVTTPPNITYRTPSPEPPGPSTSFTSSSALSSPLAPTPDSEQPHTISEEPFHPYGVNNDGAYPPFDVPWAAPSGMYLDPQNQPGGFPPESASMPNAVPDQQSLQDAQDIQHGNGPWPIHSQGWASLDSQHPQPSASRPTTTTTTGNPATGAGATSIDQAGGSIPIPNIDDTPTQAIINPFIYQVHPTTVFTPADTTLSRLASNGQAAVWASTLFNLGLPTPTFPFPAGGPTSNGDMLQHFFSSGVTTNNNNNNNAAAPMNPQQQQYQQHQQQFGDFTGAGDMAERRRRSGQ